MATATSRRALWLQKIADEVATQVRRRIAEGTVRPGQSPGTRDALAAEFVTSTSVIDRALDDLAEEGVLVASGSGFVVAMNPPTSDGFAISPAQTMQDVRSILELRLGLETVSASLAAERRTAMHLAEIEAAAAAFADAPAEAAAQADIRFHRAIASASDNSYLLDLLDYLGPLLMPRKRMPLPPTPGATGDGNLEQSVREHAVILAAISGGNAESARRAMRDHLLRTLALIDRASA